MNPKTSTQLPSANLADSKVVDLRVIRKGLPLKKMDFSEADQKRFWSRVNKNGPQIRNDLGECWIWTAGKFQKGYGAFPCFNKTLKAQRVSFCLEYGDIAPEFFVCHKCDNPSCVNPSHLFLGDIHSNGADMSAKGRAAKCGPTNPTRGELHHKSKLTEKDVLEIRRLSKTGQFAQRQLAKQFDVTRSTIFKILKRDYWKHI
jgi:hypothetical protein